MPSCCWLPQPCSGSTRRRSSAGLASLQGRSWAEIGAPRPFIAASAMNATALPVFVESIGNARAQGFGCATATAPSNCVATVSCPIFLPMSFPTSVENR
jgi:hypothetical protein